MSGEDEDFFKFWKTQPVPKMEESLENLSESEIGAIEVKDISEIQKEPYALPEGFYWANVNVNDVEELTELYGFLNQNYVEDNDAMFRFDYSKEFLSWALQPPGMKEEWLLGVRGNKNKKLFGFISAVPASIVVYGKRIQMVEINFLCVHKKLREKRLAPMLIREITRRSNINGIFQAAYTAGVVVPKPIADCRYYHRNLNPKKLIETQFTRLQPRQNMARVIKLYRLPETPQIPNIQPLKEEDLKQAHGIVTKYLERFSLHPHFSLDEFRHWFLPRDNVITTFVVKDPSTKKVTDLISFYTLPSTVINNPKHSTLKVAYSYYNVANTVSLEVLMKDALIIANQREHDVFNALELMDNKSIFEPLKFGKGDGELHYYLYNWKVPHMECEKNGLVLF